MINSLTAIQTIPIIMFLIVTDLKLNEKKKEELC